MDREQPMPKSEESTRASVDLPAVEGQPSIRRRRIGLAIIAIVSLAAVLIVSLIIIRNRANSVKTPAATDKAAQTPTVLTSHVVSKDVERQLRLPGEMRAYQDVAIYAKVQGFVETINVDRGSVVKRGQVLVRMSAPEL